MCVGAALSAPHRRVFTDSAPLTRGPGAAGSRLDLTADARLNHEIEVDYAPSLAQLAAYARAVDQAVAAGA